jgi:hypothetical protein
VTVQELQTGAVPRDSIRAALDEVFARPEFDWQDPAEAFGFLGELLGRLLEWLAGLEGPHPLVYWLLRAAIVAVLVAVLVYLGLAIWRTLRPREVSQAGGPVRSARPRDARWYLAEAARLRSAGRYAEALAHRFVALLLDLDRRKALNFHPSKTPGEYRHELELEPEGQIAFGDLVLTLYRHLFGGVTCGLEEVDAFDRAAAELGGRVAAR